jgi:DNA-binding NarL/FixJ family response regulator
MDLDVQVLAKMRLHLPSQCGDLSIGDGQDRSLRPDSLEEAVAYALDAGTAAGTDTGPARADSGLTRRERPVPGLVSQGMSNRETASSREIAGRLVMAQRTVDTHVENVLRKLGFTSRAQIAVWISERARDGSGQGG